MGKFVVAAMVLLAGSGVVPPLHAQDTTARDAGGERCRFAPDGSASSDAGAALGVSLSCTDQRSDGRSWILRNRIGVGYETGSGGGRFIYLGQFRPNGAGPIWSLRAVAVSSQFQWYFGEGNETVFMNDTALGRNRYYRARQSYFALNPAVTIPLARYTTLSVGPDLRYWETSRLGGFVDSLRPYGVGPFGTIAGLVDGRFDTRDSPAHPTEGFDLHVIGRGMVHAWDADQGYGTLYASAATYVTPDLQPLRPTLSLRVGAEKVWGTAPYQDMAHIGAGGPETPLTVRGYLPDRFTGDASAFGNAELELPIFKPDESRPANVGVLLLNDVGRVFLSGEHSSAWHDGVGGGAFYHGDRISMSVELVHGTDGTRFYIGSRL